MQKTRQNTPGSEKMWKKILKAASREEEYALLVENMDKILAGEVEPSEIDTENFTLTYNFNSYQIELDGNSAMSKRIQISPPPHHEVFIIELYLEEYPDNFTKARNLVKKLVYAEEAKQHQARMERDKTDMGKLIIIFEVIVDDMVTYYTKGLPYTSKKEIKTTFKPNFPLYNDISRRVSVAEGWAKLSDEYTRTLNTRLNLSPQSQFYFGAVLLECFSMLDIPWETPLKEIDNFMNSSGPNFSPVFRKYDAQLSRFFVDKDEEFYDSLRELFG